MDDKYGEYFFFLNQKKKLLTTPIYKYIYTLQAKDNVLEKYILNNYYWIIGRHI